MLNPITHWYIKVTGEEVISKFPEFSGLKKYPHHLVYVFGCDSIKKSPNKNVIWTTQMDRVGYSTQWVWYCQWFWIYEKNIENCYKIFSENM